MLKVKVHEGLRHIEVIKVAVAAHVVNANNVAYLYENEGELAPHCRIVLEVDQKQIFFSNAIVKYFLNQRKDSQKIDSLAQAKIDEWSEFEEKVYHGSSNEDDTLEQIASKAASTINFAKIPSVVQLDVIIVWSALFALFLQHQNLLKWKTKNPNLVSWYSQVGSQPSFKAAVGTYYVQILPLMRELQGNPVTLVNNTSSAESEQTQASIKYLTEKIDDLLSIKGTAQSGEDNHALFEEIKQLKKENQRLNYRINHLLKNYKADEERLEKEKKDLRVLHQKAEYRAQHLKKMLIKEEEKNGTKN